MHHYSFKRGNRKHQALKVAVALGAITTCASPASAAEILNAEGWTGTWNNTISYSLGARAQKKDPRIANNPVQRKSDNKFPSVGDIVTNRLNLLSELDLTHGDDYGFRVSASAWKDFAYNGFPSSGPYNGYTKRYYDQGAELLDALAYVNYDLFGLPGNLKVGRFTEFWGNVLFAGSRAISYGQSPTDGIKGSSSPGASVKELFMPRGQVSSTLQLTDTVAVGGQYAFEWRHNRLPEGGTYLGSADGFWFGPQSLGTTPRGADQFPANLHANYGVKLLWTPVELDGGTVGFYYRHFDETSPSTPALLSLSPALNYHVPFAQNVKLYGVSLDKAVGPVSVGVEASYRQNTGLSTAAKIAPPNSRGAQGDIFNLVVNGIYGLTPTFLYDTGTVTAELGYSRLMRVTKNANLFNGLGYAPCAGLSQADGCATRDNMSATIQFSPTWLQVAPGVDLKAPMTASFGLVGNGQVLGTGGAGSLWNSVTYSVGVEANMWQQYTAKIAYNGYYSAPNKTAKNAAGQTYNSTGLGGMNLNDKGWVSLTFTGAF